MTKTTKNSTLDDLARAAVGRKHERTCPLDTRAIDDEERTIELAFASETPVDRWYGMEVLDHGAKSVRMDRLNSGGALLMDHDTRDQVGAVVKGTARVDKDRVARATVKLGRSQRADEIFNDVKDGIRSLVSVGYIWHQHEVHSGTANTPDTVRVTDWEPLEISLVAVPADASVGVGRVLDPPPNESANTAVITDPRKAGFFSTEIGGTDMPIEDNTAPDTRAHADNAAPDQGGGVVNTPTQQDRSEIDKQIRAIGAKYKFADMAEEFCDLNRSVDEFREAVMKARSNVYTVPVTPDAPTPRHVIEVRPRYRQLRAFATLGEEAAHRAGMWARATIFGDQNAMRWCKDAQVRVMTTETMGGGAALVPDEMSQAIIDLREQYGVARRLCRVFPMGSDSLNIPRRTGGVTAAFYGENTATTASDKSWDIVNLTARELSALTRFSRTLAEDAVIDIAEDLAREMAWAFAKKEDECFIDGDGTSTYGGIFGLRPKIVDGTHTVGAVDASSADDTIPEIDSGDLATVMATLPEYAEARARWLCSKAFKTQVFDVIAAAAGGNTMAMIGGKPTPAYLGDEIVTSPAMPAGLATDYSDVAMAFYGDFEAACAFGDRRGFAVQVLSERYAEFRQVGVIGFERFDINIHDLGDTSVAGPVVALIGE